MTFCPEEFEQVTDVLLPKCSSCDKHWSEERKVKTQAPAQFASYCVSNKLALSQVINNPAVMVMNEQCLG